MQRIERAIESASTWGELKGLLPAGEFEQLKHWYSNGGEYVFYDGSTHLFISPQQLSELIADIGLDQFESDYLIRSDHPFSSGELPGYDEGDYPPFLELDQDKFLPRAFCHKYGKRVSSFISGSWWEFPASKYDEMKGYLASYGFSVELAEG